MPRYSLPLLVLALLASCGTSNRQPVYPAHVDVAEHDVVQPPAGYRLYREIVLTGEQVPKLVPSSELVRAVCLEYDASTGIQLTVLETRSSAVAKEAMRTWRGQQDDKQVKRIGRLFVIAQGEKPIPETITAFLHDFERKVKQ